MWVRAYANVAYAQSSTASVAIEDASIALVDRTLTNKDLLVGGVNLRTLGWSLGLPGQPRYVGVQFQKNFGERV